MTKDSPNYANPPLRRRKLFVGFEMDSTLFEQTAGEWVSQIMDFDEFHKFSAEPEQVWLPSEEGVFQPAIIQIAKCEGLRSKTGEKMWCLIRPPIGAQPGELHVLQSMDEKVSGFPSFWAFCSRLLECFKASDSLKVSESGLEYTNCFSRARQPRFWSGEQLKWDLIAPFFNPVKVPVKDGFLPRVHFKTAAPATGIHCEGEFTGVGGMFGGVEHPHLNFTAGGPAGKISFLSQEYKDFVANCHDLISVAFEGYFDEKAKDEFRRLR